MIFYRGITMKNNIKSPLNYTGNKYRILPQIQQHFPKNIKVMVDLFCGGATVGLNTPCEKVIFIDNNERVIDLLKFLSNSDYEDLYCKIVEQINKYGLSFSARNTYSYYKKQINDINSNNGLKLYNSDGYYKLRADYNNLKNKNSDYANLLLYLLMVYAFNNDIRFSKDGNFNLPVGKTDMNKNNLNKLKSYIERVKEIDCQFICSDFRSQQVLDILKSADFIYIDPPYLITTAVYNESNKWNESSEKDLLNLLDIFLASNIPFVLSNVLEKKGLKNELLYSWIIKNHNYIEVIDIDYHYRSASYNKKNRDAQEREIIIKPRG